MGIIFTDIYAPNTSQRLSAYKICCKLLDKQGATNRFKLITHCLSLIGYAKGQGIRAKREDMSLFYNQVSELVDTESKIELYFKVLSQPGLMQKLLNLIVVMGSKKINKPEIVPTDLKLATALLSIISIFLLAEKSVSIYLPDGTYHFKMDEFK